MIVSRLVSNDTAFGDWLLFGIVEYTFGSHLSLEAYLFSCTSTLLLGATRVSSGPRMHFLLGHRSD